MKRRWLLVLLGIALLSNGAPAKSKNLPEIFKNAHFVRVEGYSGDTFNPNVIPDDRHAIFVVEQQLKDWHRYSVVLERDHADLVFLVRKGRIASATARAGVAVGSGPRQRNQSSADASQDDPSVGFGGSAEAGPEDDMLAVYIVDPSQHLTGPIWTRTMKDGLDGPLVPLFQQLKHAVDAAYP